MLRTYSLEGLAKSPTKMDRVIAAGHCHTPIHIVKNLLYDPEWEVREAAADNLGIYEEVQKEPSKYDEALNFFSKNRP